MKRLFILLRAVNRMTSARSAMFQKHFALPTVSFHLGTEVCTIDLRGQEPSEQVLEDAERRANQIIFEDRRVSVRYGTAEELTRLGVRKEVDREGVLRAIEIEGVELQPCGGTHVKGTGQIGMILVRRSMRIRQDWRVEFVCGGRAEKAARRDFALLRESAEELSCAQEEVVSALGRCLRSATPISRIIESCSNAWRQRRWNQRLRARAGRGSVALERSTGSGQGKSVRALDPPAKPVGILSAPC